MALMTRDQAKSLLEKVIKLSKADHCVVTLNGSTGGNIRYARNTVTTSGSEENTTMSISSTYGTRTGTSSLNEFDDDSLQRAMRRSEELAKLAPENPEFMEPLGPQNFGESKSYVDQTAKIDAAYRAKAASGSIKPSRDKKLVSAGFLQDNAGFNAMINSKGLFAYHRSTGVNFSVTVRTEDGLGSGWAAQNSNDVRKIDTAKASQVAIKKAELSQKAVAIEPGKYTVILEPNAVSGLVGPMLGYFNARTTDEGRSFLSKPGGGNKLGEKLFDERVTIYTDPMHPEIPTSTWNNEGLPIKRTMWVEKGVVKNLVYNRFWAKQKGVEPLPGPSNTIWEGGTKTTEDLIKETERGILVTRTWYIRMVDAQTVLLTGLTRDGTFLIENGKITQALKNFRFNESPIIMLNNIDAIGKPERVGNAFIPPMRIRDFTFTSLSDAV